MNSVTTTIDLTTGGIKITWTAPNSNSDPITRYIIEIGDKTATTWTETLTNCNGS